MLNNDKLCFFRRELTDKQIIFDHALQVNKQRIENIDNSIVDPLLDEDAFDLHMYLFGNVPANTFREYVNYVHEKTQRPNWLAGLPGVTYQDEQINA